MTGELRNLDESDIVQCKDAINAYIAKSTSYLDTFLNNQKVERHIYRCHTSQQAQGQQPLPYTVTGLRYVDILHNQPQDEPPKWCPDKLLVVSMKSGDTTVWFTPLYWIVDLFGLQRGFDFTNTPWDLKHGIAKAPRWKRTQNHQYFNEHKKYSVSKHGGSDLLLRLAFRESPNTSEKRKNSLKSCVLVQASLDRDGTYVTYNTLTNFLDAFSGVYGQTLMQEMNGGSGEAPTAADSDGGDSDDETVVATKPTLRVAVTHVDTYNVFEGWKGLTSTPFPENEAQELLNHVQSLEPQVEKITSVFTDSSRWTHVQESLPTLMKLVKNDYHIRKFSEELKLLVEPEIRRFDDDIEATCRAATYSGILDFGSSKSLERPQNDIKQMGKFYIAMSSPDSTTSGIEIQEPGLIALLLTGNVDLFISAWANLSRYVIGNKIDTVKSKLQVQRHLIAAINYLVRRLQRNTTPKSCFDELLRRCEVSVSNINQAIESLKNEMRGDGRRHKGSHHIPDVLANGATFKFQVAVPLYCEVRREVFESYTRFGGKFQGTYAQLEKLLRRLGHMTVMTLFGYDTRLERYVNPEFGLNVFTQGYILTRVNCPDRWLVQTFQKDCQQVWEQARSHIVQHDDWVRHSMVQYFDAYGEDVEPYLVCYVAISSKISGPTKVAEGNLEPYGIFQSLRVHDLAAFVYVAFCEEGGNDLDFVNGYLQLRERHDEPHNLDDALAAYKYMCEHKKSPVDCVVTYYANQDRDLIDGEEDIRALEKTHRRFCMLNNSTCLDPRKGRSRCVNNTLRRLVRDYADKLCEDMGGVERQRLGLHNPNKLHVVAYRHTICDKFREVIEDDQTPEWLTKEFRGVQSFNQEWLDARLRKMFNHTLSTNTYYLVRYKIFQQYPIRLFFDCGMDIKLAGDVCRQLKVPGFADLGKSLRHIVDDLQNPDEGNENDIVEMISKWEPPKGRFLNIGNYPVKQLTVDSGQYESGIVTAIYDDDGNEEEVELPLEKVLKAIRPSRRASSCDTASGKQKKKRQRVEEEPDDDDDAVVAAASSSTGKGRKKKTTPKMLKRSPAAAAPAPAPAPAAPVVENRDFSIKYIGGDIPTTVFTYIHSKTSPSVYYYRGAVVNPQDGNRVTKVVQVWGHSHVEGEEDKYEAVLVAEGSITTMEDLTTFLEANNMEFGAKGDVSMFTSSGTKISPPFERMSWDNVPYYCSSSSMLRTRRSQQGSSDISLWTQAK